LRDIFINTCRGKGYSFQGAIPGGGNPIDLDLFFKNMYDMRDRSTFANARDVLSIANDVMANVNMRAGSGKIVIPKDFGVYGKYFIKRDLTSVDEVYGELDKFVGLGFIVDIFKRLKAKLELDKDNIARGVPVTSQPDHYILVGNPGTGKTTVGKMMGQLLHIIGEVGAPEVLFYTAANLKGDHFGEGEKKVLACIKEAKKNNAALYIDEAHQFIDSGYGSQIIGAMMTSMTEDADKFKIIFGVYADRLTEFLQLDPGLERRVNIIEFPDYTPEQLLEIFVRNAEKNRCTIAPDALKSAGVLLKGMYDSRDEHFGNAGTVVKFFNEANIKRHLRTSGFDPNDPLKYVIIAEDLP
jgi:hypothetical protein